MHENAGEGDLEARDDDNITCTFARLGGPAVESDLINTSTASEEAILLGNSVTVSCSADKGIGPVLYAVFYKQDKQTSWSKVRGYSSETQVVITPKAATAYTIRVKAKDASGKIVNKDIRLNVAKTLANTSSLSAEQIFLGNSVTVSCASVGGSGTVKYAVYYKQNTQTTWTKVTDYSTTVTASVKPKAATSYTIRVKAKDASGKIVNKDLPLTVKKDNTLKNTSTLSSESIILGNSVTVNCMSSGGSGTTEFAVYYKQNTQTTWTRVTDYSTAVTASVKPKAATSYTIRVKAKDNSDKIVNKDLSLSVTKPVHDPLNPPTSGEAGDPRVEGNKKTLYSMDDYYTVAREDDEDYTPLEVLPASVDNSTSEYFPPIVNQVGSSCASYAISYYLHTYMYNKYHSIPTTRNTVFSPRFNYNITNGAIPRGNTSDTVCNYLASTGSVTRDYYPFGQDVFDSMESNDYHYTLPVDEEAYRFAADHKIKYYFKFTNYGSGSGMITSPDSGSIQPIKAALADGNVLITYLYNQGFKLIYLKEADDPGINKGVVGESCWAYCTSEKGDHVVTVVGYNDNIWSDINDNGKIDSGEMGAFKIANSWGEWGNDGFIWMPYDALNEYSRVPGVGYQSGRLLGMYHITGIKMVPDEELPSVFLKYSEKTNDRNNSYVYLTGSYNGKTVTECVDPFNRKDDPTTGYLNCQYPDKYIHFVYSIQPKLEKLGTDDYTKVRWMVSAEHDADNGKSLSVTDICLCDEKNYRIYRPVTELPLNISYNSASVMLSDSFTRYANVYHRGFENDSISYYFNGQSNNVVSAQMEEASLMRGYTHRYMIDLLGNESAQVCFSGNNKSDPADGEYYTVYPGDNFFGNEQNIEALESTVTVSSKRIAPGDKIKLYAESEGGIAPYRYRYDITDAETGEKVFEGVYGDDRIGRTDITDPDYAGKQNTYTFKKAGAYRVTVYSSDYADNTVTDTIDLSVADHTFRFVSFENENGQTEFGTDTEVTAVYTTELDDLETDYQLIVFRDNKEIFRQRVSADSGERDDDTGLVTGTFKWNTSEPGKYQLILCRTVGSIYSYTEMFVNVVPGISISSLDIGSPDSTIAAGDTITLTAQVADGNAPYGFIFSYFRYGKEERIQDYDQKSSCSFKVPEEPGMYTLYVLAEDNDLKLGVLEKKIWVLPKR